MTPDMKERLEKRRKALYLAVKQQRPELYEGAVKVGHMAMVDFGGSDEVKRAAAVECAAMSLAAEAAGDRRMSDPQQSTPRSDAKIGFADAVRRRGDSWVQDLYDSKIADKISAGTMIALRESGHLIDWKDSLRMHLCETTEGRLFQLEQPLYRCGCDGLCERHPDCPGVVYQPGFPYRRGKE